MIRLAMIFWVLVSTVSCMVVQHVPPERVPVQTSAVFDADYERVWDATVDWFASRNIRIGKLDKEAGYVNSEYTLSANFEILNCGSVEAKPKSGFIMPDWNLTDPIVRLNFTVRKLSDDRARVNVNMSGHTFFSAEDGFAVSRWARCVSTGSLEGAVFEFVRSVSSGADDAPAPLPLPFEDLPEAKAKNRNLIEI